MTTVEGPTTTTTATMTTTDVTILTTEEEETTDMTTKADRNSTRTISTCVIGNFPSFDRDLLALWRFDNNVIEEKTSYSATMMNNPSFLSKGYINADISLVDGGSSSYIEASYVQFDSSSFTIELWMRIESFRVVDMTLVSQNDLALRVNSNGKVYNSIVPPSVNTQIVLNNWYHVAFVYDVDQTQQQIYINGKLDSTLEIQLNFTDNSTFYIGTLDGTVGYFNGEIDHLSITTRVKLACEILRDASLVASYTFSLTPDIRSDSGPYGITGLLGGTGSSIPGVVGNGLLTNSSSDYFQISGLTALTIKENEFSFTFFIKPFVIQACVLIFLSGAADISDTDEAKPYLGIDSTGHLVAELRPTLVVGTTITISVNVWSHVALTYSYPNNRVSIYYNGTLQVTVPGPGSSYKPPTQTPPLYVTLANPLEGPSGSVIQAQRFIGIIDEFNIWSRELNASEIYEAALLN